MFITFLQKESFMSANMYIQQRAGEEDLCGFYGNMARVSANLINVFHYPKSRKKMFFYLCNKSIVLAD